MTELWTGIDWWTWCPVRFIKNSCDSDPNENLHSCRCCYSSDGDGCVAVSSSLWLLLSVFPCGPSCVTNRQTGLHKPRTAPWTSSQPLLCYRGFCQGATWGRAFCTCMRTEGKENTVFRLIMLLPAAEEQQNRFCSVHSWTKRELYVFMPNNKTLLIDRKTQYCININCIM